MTHSVNSPGFRSGWKCYIMLSHHGHFIRIAASLPYWPSKMAESTEHKIVTSVPSKGQEPSTETTNMYKQKESEQKAPTQPHTVSSPSVTIADNETLEDGQDQIEGPFTDFGHAPGSEFRVDNVCTVEEKELSDLVRQGILSDSGADAARASLTMDDVSQSYDEAGYSVQWRPAKGKGKTVNVRNIGLNEIQERSGLSDDELASLLQACPDLDFAVSENGGQLHLVH